MPLEDGPRDEWGHRPVVLSRAAPAAQARPWSTRLGDATVAAGSAPWSALNPGSAGGTWTRGVSDEGPVDAVERVPASRDAVSGRGGQSQGRPVVITYVLLAAVLMPIAMALIAAVVYGHEHDPPAVAQREDEGAKVGVGTL